MVKDLWELRLQLVKDKTDATDEESAVFSSQPVSDADTDRDEESLGRTRKIRAKTIPSLIETLGLLYLGMVLLHLPISMGDVHRYVKSRIDFCNPSSYNEQLGYPRRCPLY